MNGQSTSSDFLLEPVDNQRLANLCGKFDEHLRQMEQRLGVEINNRGNLFRIIGDDKAPVQVAEHCIRELYATTDSDVVTPEGVHLMLQQQAGDIETDAPPAEVKGVETAVVKTPRAVIKGRGTNQLRYLHNVRSHDVNFGVGPAGTGKTYLAVACAIEALEQEQVQRIILTRPAVEAGERLGFLPGDLAQKIDPYLRPLYDALYEMLGFERVAKLMERHVIEIAPLAYMRGRTLNDAFVILDEAQNTTREQMKMFLTRIGFNSKAIITGDVTQVDLPRGVHSGLRHAVEVLAGVDDISFTFFKAKDVVRHALVQRIVQAYDAHDRKQPADGNPEKKNEH
ncbi:phosphate starvation-inducible protein PhoH [Candidatus Tenderia electrophaga]|uniref:PhoH-like protein n=1 Tax=Candidatus Tenderia electrophaga TaxID=1748243 RepID=A0A0S2TA70_9GAMM|nr:phosphate starvation-inducible protein PhoH [Candidatus Tenderia electrophaga]